MLSFVACAGETLDDTMQAVEAPTETVQSEVPDEAPGETEKIEAPGETTQEEHVPRNPGRRFCTRHLAEGEVLIVEADHGDRIWFDSIDDLLRSADRESGGPWRTEVLRVEILDERTGWFNLRLPWRHEGAQPFLRGDSHPWWESDDYMPSTFHRARVLEVFRGEVEVGDIIEIRQSGGQIGNIQMVNRDFAYLTPGDDLLLFLQSLSWLEDIPRGLYSPEAVYRFPDFSGDRAFSLDESLESAYEGSLAEWILPLTLNDLAEIQLENFGRVSESFEAALEAARR